MFVITAIAVKFNNLLTNTQRVYNKWM